MPTPLKPSSMVSYWKLTPEQYRTALLNYMGVLADPMSTFYCSLDPMKKNYVVTLTENLTDNAIRMGKEQHVHRAKVLAIDWGDMREEVVDLLKKAAFEDVGDHNRA